MQTKHKNFAACQSVSINHHLLLIIYFCIFCICCNSIRWVRSNWATASWNDMGFILNCCLTTNSRDRWRVTSLKFERDEA